MSTGTPAHPLPWQFEPWTRVRAAGSRGQLHHAWLLSGPEGVGKRSFARAWAAGALCERADAEGQACAACGSCRMLAAGGHPDAHLISHDGHLGLSTAESLQQDDGLSYWIPKPGSMRRDIAVDAVRSFIDKLAVASHRGGLRVTVIQPASDLSASAANALLKTVEEPPARTLLLFIDEFPQALPQTIRSRCQQLRFAAPPATLALPWLQQRHPEADAALLDEAGGAPLKAATWVEQGELARRQAWRQTLAQVQARSADPLAAAQALSRDKAESARVLRLWQQILLEQRRQGNGWGARHEAFLGGLIEGLRRLEQQNANPQLLFETLLLRWRALEPGGASA